MREIELKFKVDNLDVLINKLKEEQCEISAVKMQNDTIYVQNLDDTESKEGSVWLRVRKENDKIELNYKKQSKKKMESEEIEFEVSSYELANQFLKALGYLPWVEVNKKRRYSKYKEYNICIDEVERLGSFIELEILVDKDNKEDYELALLEVAKKLGINPDKRINSHYDTMISELNN
jgi:adenylate cyclase class 2